MIRITTTYKTNVKGTGQIVAKGGGKQRTMPYAQEHSPEWNHGAAAGLLANALNLGKTRTTITLHTRDNGNARFDLA